MFGQHKSERLDLSFVTTLNGKGGGGGEHILGQFLVIQVRTSYRCPMSTMETRAEPQCKSCLFLFWAVSSRHLDLFVLCKVTNVFLCNYLKWKLSKHLGTSSNSHFLWLQPNTREFPEFRRVLSSGMCSPVEVDWRFGGTCRLDIQGRRVVLKKQPARSKQTATRLHGVTLTIHRCVNLKFNMFRVLLQYGFSWHFLFIWI
jgi:hypothetical protein